MKRYIGSVLFAVFLCLFMFAVTSESPSIEAAQVNSGGEAVSNNEAPPSVEYIISFELPADDRVIRLSAVQESIIIMLRILKVLVTAVVVGFLFFRYVIWGAGRKELSALFELQSERRLYWTAVILLGGAGAAEIGMLSHLFSGTEANSWITEVRIMTTTTIRGTTAYITPFLACILLLSAYFGYTEGRWTKMFKLVLAVAIVCTFPLSGHAYGSFLNVVFHALHMLAASIWFGGLIGILVQSWRKEKDGRFYPHLQQLIDRFSRAALPLIMLVVLSALVLTLPRLNDWGDLVHSRYGITILSKMALLMGIFVIAGMHRFVFMPRMVETASDLTITYSKPFMGLLIGIRIEVILAMLLFALAGMLSTAQPPDVQ